MRISDWRSDVCSSDLRRSPWGSDPCSWGSRLDVDDFEGGLVVGIDADFGGDLHRLLRQRLGVLFVIDQRARRRKGVIAARSDRRDTALGSEPAAVAGADPRPKSKERRAGNQSVRTL